jgi:two-component system, response regulator RegA
VISEPEWGDLQMALILVVDDERDACLMLRRILSAMGHDVVTFNAAHSALEWLQGQVPQLAVLDYRLPDLDGLQLLGLMRSNYPDVKVLMLTAYPSAEVAAEAMALGAIAYLLKPIEIEELEARVEESLSAIA